MRSTMNDDAETIDVTRRGGLRAVLAGLAALAVSPRVAAARPDDMETDLWGLALGGVDPTSYFDAGGPVHGDPHNELHWAGATWRFRSPEAMSRFLMSPTRYAPAFGGRCAWMMASGERAYGDPQYFAIYDGRLFLFAGAAERDAFLEDPAQALRLAADQDG